MCKTFVVSFGAFLNLACKFAFLSKASEKVFHALAPPGLLIGSLNRLDLNRLLRTCFIKWTASWQRSIFLDLCSIYNSSGFWLTCSNSFLKLDTFDGWLLQTITLRQKPQLERISRETKSSVLSQLTSMLVTGMISSYMELILSSRLSWSKLCPYTVLLRHHNRSFLPKNTLDVFVSTFHQKSYIHLQKSFLLYATHLHI